MLVVVMGIIGLKQLDKFMVLVQYVTQDVKNVEMLPIIYVLDVILLLCIYKRMVNLMGHAVVVI